MEVPSVGTPKIYFGKAEFEEAKTNDNDLQKILEITNRTIQLSKAENNIKFDVLANSDSAGDIHRAIQFGAEGIGLCRTEHMFFEKERINFFRLLLISDVGAVREACLEKLKSFQKKDFLEIFSVLEGKPLTVRALDAPLHEFIPNTTEELQEVQQLLEKYVPGSKEEDIKDAFQRLEETNPMLGHRGCRFGISFPEVYEMQETALLEAAFEYYTRKPKHEVNLKVMFPLVGIKEELDFLRNGKNIEDRVILGFKGIINSVCKKFNFEEVPFPLQIGVMIEVPASALSAREIAEKAEFFSFGTNDLVQMTYGMSRDDINSFYPAYTQYDIIEKNPFIHLLDATKKLILHSIDEGKLKRADLYTSICGEHGANPDTVRFCIENKINAVSCSSFNLPVVKLVTAQHLID
jgi:pyruvate,orthophosphate dikinase